MIEKMAEKFEGERTEPKKINIDIMGEFKVMPRRWERLSRSQTST